jgi:hypothetical protein
MLALIDKLLERPDRPACGRPRRRAGLRVFGAGTLWPDAVVAAIMGGLGLLGSWQIVTHAHGKLRGVAAVRGVAAE